MGDGNSGWWPLIFLFFSLEICGSCLRWEECVWTTYFDTVRFQEESSYTECFEETVLMVNYNGQDAYLKKWFDFIFMKKIINSNECLYIFEIRVLKWNPLDSFWKKREK